MLYVKETLVNISAVLYIEEDEVISSFVSLAFLCIEVTAHWLKALGNGNHVGPI